MFTGCLRNRFLCALVLSLVKDNFLALRLAAYRRGGTGDGQPQTARVLILLTSVHSHFLGWKCRLCLSIHFTRLRCVNNCDLFSFCCSYVISGDGNGKLNIWDWKTTKLYSRFKAHDKVCIGAVWHPHETSKVITCGWDGLIKLWD